MKKKLATNFSLSLILIGTSAPLLFAAAKNGSYNFAEESGLEQTSNAAGYDTGSAAKPLESYITNIITVILSLLGVIFMGLMIYAGITWMTAQGNQEKATKAKELLIEAIIGLIIVLAAYAVSYFVVKMTGGALIQ